MKFGGERTMEEPMYIKIHNQIKRDVENHVYKVGDRIPAERQLAVKFGVSRMTLRQAIKTLEEEGILERRLGSGTYVASQKVQEKMSGISTHLYETLNKNGYRIGRVTEHISAAVANENDARLLNAKKGEALITRRQVTELSNGQPFEYTRARYVAERFEFTFSK